MDALVEVIVFVVSIAVVWYFAGTLVEAVSRIARRFCKNGFFMAFFVLGFLTSISEFSVALNSVATGIPQVSVGNLAGASFVILMLIVPVLAVLSGGIRLNDAVSKRNMLLILASIALPAVLVIDGDVSRSEGLLAILAYGTVAFALYRQKQAIETCEVDMGDGRSIRPLLSDIGRVFFAAIAIFVAAHFLVKEAVYFAEAFQVPGSLIGLILLSVGTNIPEIVIAVRSILRGRTDIAFGDYLGSAAMNTFIFGLLALVAGTFAVEAREFVITAILSVSGFAALYVFAHTKHMVSRGEGMVLLLFYAAFVALQLAAAASAS